MDEEKLTLKNLCIVSIAAHLWDLKKNEVYKMHHYFRHARVKPEEEIWNRLTQEVIKPLETINLPYELYDEIVYSVYLMKQRRIEWLQHLRDTYSFHDMTKEEFLDLCLRKIYWTHSCTVDEEKTLSSCYFDFSPKTDSDWWKLFIVCSQYCSELHVKQIMLNMQIHTNSKSVEKVNFYESYECHLALYWYKWYFHMSLRDFITDIKRKNGDPLNFYDQKQNLAENMLKLALHCSFKKAVMYFWVRVSKEKRESIILDYFKNPSNNKLFKYLILGNKYKGMQKCEIYLFIWNNVSENIRKLIAATDNFDQNVVKCRDLCIWDWPIDMLNFQINIMKKYFTQELYEDFSSAIAHQCKKIYSENLKLPVKENKFVKNFNHLWKMIPSSYKQKVAEKVIDDLFGSWDVLNLKMILNDEDVNPVREKLIMKGCGKFVLFAEENNQEKIQEFLTELTIPENLAKDDKEILRNLYQQITDGKFDMEKWPQKSKSPSGDIKEYIDEKFICYYLIKRDELDLADKFLIWKLGNAEKVKSFKATFYADKFSVDHIYKLWDLNRGNARNAEIQCNRFLNWFLNDRKKETFFIQEKFAKAIISIPSTLEYLFVEKENIDMINDFLIWIGLTKKQIRSCKNKLFKNSLPSLIERYLAENKIEIARKWLDFAFDSEEKKNNFLMGFFEKKAAIRGVKSFISDIGSFDVFEPKLSEEEITKKMKDFIYFWCKPLEKFDRLKKELERWPEVCRMEIDPTKADSAELNKIYLEDAGEEPDRYDYINRYDAYLEDYYAWCDEAGIYFVFCEEENLKIFMKLLRDFEANNREFCY